MNRLILGDNLEIMKTLESESVDLIYLDPPFFSNRNYEIIRGDEDEVRSFKDRWAGGISHQTVHGFFHFISQLLFRSLAKKGKILHHGCQG